MIDRLTTHMSRTHFYENLSSTQNIYLKPISIISQEMIQLYQQQRQIKFVVENPELHIIERISKGVRLEFNLQVRRSDRFGEMFCKVNLDSTELESTT